MPHHSFPIRQNMEPFSFSDPDDDSDIDEINAQVLPLFHSSSPSSSPSSSNQLTVIFHTCDNPPRHHQPHAHIFHSTPSRSSRYTLLLLISCFVPPVLACFFSAALSASPASALLAFLPLLPLLHVLLSFGPVDFDSPVAVTMTQYQVTLSSPSLRKLISVPIDNVIAFRLLTFERHGNSNTEAPEDQSLQYNVELVTTNGTKHVYATRSRNVHKSVRLLNSTLNMWTQHHDRAPLPHLTRLLTRPPQARRLHSIPILTSTNSTSTTRIRGLHHSNPRVVFTRDSTHNNVYIIVALYTILISLVLLSRFVHTRSSPFAFFMTLPGLVSFVVFLAALYYCGTPSRLVLHSGIAKVWPVALLMRLVFGISFRSIKGFDALYLHTGATGGKWRRWELATATFALVARQRGTGERVDLVQALSAAEVADIWQSIAKALPRLLQDEGEYEEDDDNEITSSV